MTKRIFSGAFAAMTAIICLGGCATTPVEPVAPVAQSGDPESLGSGDALGTQMFAPPVKSTEVTSVDAN